MNGPVTTTTGPETPAPFCAHVNRVVYGACWCAAYGSYRAHRHGRCDDCNQIFAETYEGVRLEAQATTT